MKAKLPLLFVFLTVLTSTVIFLSLTPEVEAATGNFGDWHWEGYALVGTLTISQTGSINHIDVSARVVTQPLAVNYAITFDEETIGYGSVAGISETISASLDVCIFTYVNDVHTVTIWIDPAYGFIEEGSQTASITYTPYYYLTVSTAYGTTTSQGYKESGAIVYAGINTGGPIPLGTGSQAIFSKWSIGGTNYGTNYAQSDGIVMNADKTIVASWTTQYYLTVNNGGHSTATGAGWYNSGSYANAGVSDATVAGTTGTRYVFSSWGGDASGTFNLQSNVILMNAPKTAVANWQTQYYLTVTSNYGTPSGTGWYYSGTTAYAGLSSGTVAGTTGTQYIFSSWGTDASGSNYAQSVGITMNAPKTATASWTTQYYLTISSTYGSPTGQGWYNAGATASFGITTPASGSTGTRYVFASWSGSGTGSYTGSMSSTSITINNPITETASWTTQYYLTVTSAYGTPSGANWYNSGTTAYAGLNTGTSGNNVFDHWSNDASGTNYAQSNGIIMNAPKTAVALWNTLSYNYITAATSAGGSINPTGTVQVLNGNDQTFTITTNNGYELTELYIDNILTTIQSNTTFTFYNVIASHSIYVVFGEIYNETTGTGNLAIGQFSAPPVATSGNPFVISTILNTIEDYNTLKNATINLSQGITLTWNNLDVFNATSTVGAVTLSGGTSTVLNSTAVRLRWTITLSSQLNSGIFNVISAEVYDLTDNTATSSQEDFFTFISFQDNTGGGGGGGGGGGSRRVENNTTIVTSQPEPTVSPTEIPAAVMGTVLIVLIITVAIIIGIARSKSTKQLWKDRGNAIV